jgi:hypothetical protein
MLASFGCGKRLGRDELLENVQRKVASHERLGGKRLFRGVRLLTGTEFSDGKSRASRFLNEPPSFRFGTLTRNREKFTWLRAYFGKKRVFSLFTRHMRGLVLRAEGRYPRCTMVLM